jgi:hypothetical protein
MTFLGAGCAIGAGGSDLWIPDRIVSKLLLAHRADRVLADLSAKNLTLDGSSNLSSWAADIAGVSATITQSSSGSRPPYDTTTWAKPSLHGDGTRLLTAAGLAVPGDFCLFVVASTNGFVEEQGNSAFGEGGDWEINATPGLFISRSAGATTRASAYNYTYGPPCFGTANAVLYEHRCQGTHATQTLMVNGVPWPLTAFGPPYTTDPGANNTASSALYLMGNPTHGSMTGNLIAAYLIAHPTDQDVLDMRQYIQRELKMFRAGEGVCLGDSTSAAFAGQHSLGSLIYTADEDPLQARVAMLATPSDTAAGQLAKWNTAGPKGWPGQLWAFVLIEINGLIENGENASTALGQINNLCNAVRASNVGTRIIVMPPLPCKARMIARLGATAGAACYAEWQTLKGLVLAGGVTAANVTLPFPAALDDGLGNLAAAYDIGDGIHENDTARALIAAAVRAAL